MACANHLIIITQIMMFVSPITPDCLPLIRRIQLPES